MFIDFFYYLRKRGVKVSIGEWMVLLEGMKKDCTSPRWRDLPAVPGSHFKG